MSDTINDICARINQELNNPRLVQVASNIGSLEYIPTGVYSIDDALIGFPKGRYTSIEGHPGTFKTSLALRVAANVDSTLFLDCEHALDSGWISRFCDPDKVAIALPSTMEEAYDVAITVAEQRAFDLLIIDSISALAPLDEIDKGQSDDPVMAIRARHTNRFFRSIVSFLGRPDSITVIGINHLTTTMAAYGAQYVVPCGRAQGYAATLRLSLRGIKKLEGDNDEGIIGMTIQWGIEKRKMPAKTNMGEFDVFNTDAEYSGRKVKAGDIDEVRTIVRKLADDGKIKVSGSWYTLNGEKYHGIKELRPALAEMIDEMYRGSVI